MKITIAELRQNGFSRELLKKSEAWDELYSVLGKDAPRKRLLHVDYKERGRDMNRSHVLYQPLGVSDEQMIASLMQTYEERGCTVSGIIEIDSQCRVTAVHYVRPGFLEECVQDLAQMAERKER